MRRRQKRDGERESWMGWVGEGVGRVGKKPIDTQRYGSTKRHTGDTRYPTRDP